MTAHIDPAAAFADTLAAELVDQDVAVLSPDTGGVKRARHYADALSARLNRPVPMAFVEKYRSQDVVSGGTIVGDVDRRTVVIVDDMVVGGTTLARAADACRAVGARRVVAAAAHGAFTVDAAQVLAGAAIERLFVLDHIPPAALPSEVVNTRLRLVDSAPVIAAAIRRLASAGAS